MSSRRKIAIGVAIWLGLGGTVFGQRDRTPFPDPAKGYQWEQEAKKHKLDPADIQTLGKHKVLITNEVFKQVFDPYIQSSLPIFITSDSLLNGYHVLFEESILRLERANARKLPEILRFIWNNLGTVDAKLKGKPELAATAKQRAQIIIGVALKLLGEETVKPDRKLAALIDAEVARVTAGAGQQKPAWLGPPDPGFAALDYSRYLPRGFYTRSKYLERYFRAVSWLQSIPFRVAKDEELLSILMLGNCLTYQRFVRQDFDKGQEYHTFFRTYGQFLGVGDDWDLLAAAHQAQGELTYDLDGDALAQRREYLLKDAQADGQGPKINDQLRFAPEDPTQTAEVGYRILAAYRLPDAVLFQRTTDLRKLQRPFPSGLEVCAALGSAFARSKLSEREKEELLQTIDQCKPLFSGSSLYGKYLNCVSVLLADPERDAPAFMGQEAWKIKSCQTALAGWSQLRHTWVLQAKLTVYSLGLTQKPHGFVEPNPEFFARMARLVGETEGLLRSAGAFEPDTHGFADDLRALVAFLKKKDAIHKGEEAFKTLSLDEMSMLDRTGPLLDLLDLKPDEKDQAKVFQEIVDKVPALADKLERGEMLGHPKFARVVKARAGELEPLWRRLEGLCRRLEALAHKQLRGAAFSADEKSFLIGYGESLAGIMFYGGNSYQSPRDDAPRVVEVFHNPAGGFLEVGIARPRALYILYPVKGGEILCRGAVLPYYEFQHPTRLTDTAWKELLDGKQRPDIPSWVRPVVGREGLTAPKRDEGP
jgi:hypothetical protein